MACRDDAPCPKIETKSWFKFACPHQPTHTHTEKKSRLNDGSNYDARTTLPRRRRNDYVLRLRPSRFLCKLFWGPTPSLISAANRHSNWRIDDLCGRGSVPSYLAFLLIALVVPAGSLVSANVASSSVQSAETTDEGTTMYTGTTTETTTSESSETSSLSTNATTETSQLIAAALIAT
jgi:hypothetical protein